MKQKLKVVDFQMPAPSDDVAAALSLLSETLGEEHERIKDKISVAAHADNYKTARTALKFAQDLAGFKDKVESLMSLWKNLEQRRRDATPEVQAIVGKSVVLKKFPGRTKKGVLTPEHAYFRPILEVLEEMGGSGDSKEVIAKVGEKMKGILKPQDYERLKSKGNPIVWVNKTQWARNEMANHDGRMKPKKKTGIWEISDKGRKWLKDNTDK
jgi:hypothetical protein